MARLPANRHGPPVTRPTRKQVDHQNRFDERAPDRLAALVEARLERQSLDSWPCLERSCSGVTICRRWARRALVDVDAPPHPAQPFPSDDLNHRRTRASTAKATIAVANHSCQFMSISLAESTRRTVLKHHIEAIYTGA